jgi:hypothetical protein
VTPAGSQYSIEERVPAPARRQPTVSASQASSMAPTRRCARHRGAREPEAEPFGLVIAKRWLRPRGYRQRCSGAREIFTQGIDALAHPPGDSAALAECIARLAADEGLRGQLGVAARQTAERRFNRRRLASELAPIYQSPLRAAS